MMNSSNAMRSGKTILYAVGLCLASVAGYLIGNIHIEDYNSELPLVILKGKFPQTTIWIG